MVLQQTGGSSDNCVDHLQAAVGTLACAEETFCRFMRTHAPARPSEQVRGLPAGLRGELPDALDGPGSFVTKDRARGFPEASGNEAGPFERQPVMQPTHVATRGPSHAVEAFKVLWLFTDSSLPRVASGGSNALPLPEGVSRTTRRRGARCPPGPLSRRIAAERSAGACPLAGARPERRRRADRRGARVARRAPVGAHAAQGRLVHAFGRVFVLKVMIVAAMGSDDGGRQGPRPCWPRVGVGFPCGSAFCPACCSWSSAFLGRSRSTWATCTGCGLLCSTDAARGTPRARRGGYILSRSARFALKLVGRRVLGATGGGPGRAGGAAAGSGGGRRRLCGGRHICA